MKISKIAVLALLLTIFWSNKANAQGLGDIFGGGLGNTIGNMLEGVFSSSDITVADMTGDWTSTGPAVCFQGEGFLKKAGGVAAAAAIETKLAPYYEQYGLTNATLTVTEDGKFTLNCKMLKMSGTITPKAGGDKGVFEFNFTALGMKLATVTTYVQKTSSSMDVMFDATKLKNLLSAVAQFTGIKTVQTITSILDSYEGLCVGFHFAGQQQQTQSSSGIGIGDILGGFGIGTGSDTNTNTNTNKNTNKNTNNKNTNSNKNTNNKNTNSNNSNTSTGSTGLDLLRDILTGGKKK